MRKRLLIKLLVLLCYLACPPFVPPLMAAAPEKTVIPAACIQDIKNAVQTGPGLDFIFGAEYDAILLKYKPIKMREGAMYSCEFCGIPNPAIGNAGEKCRCIACGKNYDGKARASEVTDLQGRNIVSLRAIDFSGQPVSSLLDDPWRCTSCEANALIVFWRDRIRLFIGKRARSRSMEICRRGNP